MGKISYSRGWCLTLAKVHMGKFAKPPQLPPASEKKPINGYGFHQKCGRKPGEVGYQESRCIRLNVNSGESEALMAELKHPREYTNHDPNGASNAERPIEPDGSSKTVSTRTMNLAQKMREKSGLNVGMLILMAK